MQNKFMIHEATFKFEMGQEVPAADKIDWTFIADHGISCLDQKDREAIKAVIAKSKDCQSLIDALKTHYENEREAMRLFNMLKTWR